AHRADERQRRLQLPDLDGAERGAVARVVARGARGLLLTALRTIGVFATAALGVWLFYTEFVHLSRLAWWYDSTQVLLAAPSNPDYDLTTLEWQLVKPQQFDLRDGRLTLTTSTDAYGYQAYANIRRNGANTAGLLFDADIASGGITIGIQQAGEWIASNNSPGIGRFADLNSALLGFRRTVTVVIANRNPDGASRATIASLRIYLRK